MTICLPLFLAGGEGDRAFARYYPTVAVDGCELRCAARATEMFSAKPAASIVVTDLIDHHRMEKPHGARRLDKAGLRAVDLTAERIAGLVDELLGNRWNRSAGELINRDNILPLQVAAARTRAGLPVPAARAFPCAG